MKKLACLAGVVLAYFSIFFFGQINFAPPSERIYVRLKTSIADTAKFVSNELGRKKANQSTKSRFELFCKTPGYLIYLLEK